MATRSRRAVLSLTTRFCLPHEGMTTLDYLSRHASMSLYILLTQPLLLHASSAASQTSSAANSLSVVTCQHVACPWLFPKYFAATWDWLQFVNEDFVQHSLQLLAVDETTLKGPSNTAHSKPEVLLELPLAPQVRVHEDRDLALLTLDAKAVKDWEHVAHKLGLEALELRDEDCKEGEELFYSGHRQFKDEEEEGFQVPTAVEGHFVGRSKSGQEFAWSQELLEEGMCGGAVVGATGECVGIVEGIVPPRANSLDDEDIEPPNHDREAHAAWQMREALAGHVAFVPSTDVRAFIEQPGSLVLTGMDLPPGM
ncbi:hypothetical protein BBO99_00000398 [Phytophthora kernoviae]|uniref:Uncharacterized protein n=1 Tax=Phytophthora kernoviae TaxID=325452 RepID=A0A3R7FZU2_9STRA|nr:hypothetical protein JM16_000449 [Phytophthora kernoviae]KAG2533283.1 hypothetical protein JM18_000521 [Phytophthora kernoviae]RLN14557.1 hypothetical protein BBI17_000419 [Phytophthora kernoviae]RLN85615.1 hypothetical protein BBO99_00000398 [Phytophthora kernoviae]